MEKHSVVDMTSASGAFEMIGGNPYYYHKIIERKKNVL
jgi:hypothetical protein